MNHWSRKHTDEHGFFTIWTLGLCVLLFFIGGISLDLWRGFADRRELAAMTDAAAIAAASEIDLPAFQATPSVLRLDAERARLRAVEYMTSEAAASGMQLTDVQVVVVEDAVQVVATKQLEVSLTKILYSGEDIDVTTTSAAEARINE